MQCSQCAHKIRTHVKHYGRLTDFSNIATHIIVFYVSSNLMCTLTYSNQPNVITR